MKTKAKRIDCLHRLRRCNVPRWPCSAEVPSIREEGEAGGWGVDVSMLSVRLCLSVKKPEENIEFLRINHLIFKYFVIICSKIAHCYMTMPSVK